MSGAFRPPAWLANPHAQSIFPSLPFRRPGVERRCRILLEVSRDEILDCGEGVRLLAHRATQATIGRPPATRMAVLLHGWEGSADSLYVLSLGQFLLDRGFDVVRLNLRDHGDSHHLNEEIFHSCRIREVVGAVRRLQEMEPDRGMNLVGFSLGGNFFLRVGARAAQAGLRLEQVVAICPVLDPGHTLVRLERGWALYRNYFVWKWKRSLRTKQAAWPRRYDLTDALALTNLTDMTDHLVRVYGGYPSLAEYLRGYSRIRRGSSRRPTTRSSRRRTLRGWRVRPRCPSPAPSSAGIAASTTRNAAAPGSSGRSARRSEPPDDTAPVRHPRSGLRQRAPVGAVARRRGEPGIARSMRRAAPSRRASVHSARRARRLRMARSCTRPPPRTTMRVHRPPGKRHRARSLHRAGTARRRGR
jgi:predicted alpha/beta-fold hydrolase